MLSKDSIRQQSVAAWTVWRKKWLNNCAVTKGLAKTPIAELVDECKGQIIVQAAFGASLSKNIDALKRHRSKYKLVCCDKAYGYLMANRIKPDYCVIADASVTTEWIGDHNTSETTLVANIASNPDWTKNWKGRLTFYANWDNIGTAPILSKAAGVFDVIPASSNVSNAQVVFTSQILNPKVQLLLGYDYSWRSDGHYYANGDSPKRYYMHHVDVISPYGYVAMTSSNLAFSSSWLLQFLMKFSRLEVVNCSEEGIFGLPNRMPFEQAIIKYTKGVIDAGR